MGGKDGEGSNRDGNRVAIERGQWEREEDGKGAMGRVERGKRWGRAWGEEGARDFTDLYDGMPGWT